ncbi:MAG: ATP phosphoribosyltransferase regulatory subunit [Clostridiales bacterium]|nr:ATP phosphoribosyltransferase regulatory subunit [Clostridiales bacterium]MDD7035051.1 ATP phosphoribosyltransferase regulatory subunit [Bacillota bacterium]MDY2920376.1 ATP phosphoribosyltransferase regulatory subunit [Lentihominibacter sp.]
MIDEKILRTEEKIIFALRALYSEHGYKPVRLSKFEEYELYAHNKDFIGDDRIITFNDSNGKLMALKPDVTLSIVKNGKDIPGHKQKVSYNENIYRTTGREGRFSEIMQAGLECIGDIDSEDILQVISLAAQTLELISEDFVLEISHLGILSALLGEISEDESFLKKAAEYIRAKNVHDMEKLCREHEIPEEQAKRLITFTGICGDLDTVMGQLEPICTTEATAKALAEFEDVGLRIRELGYGERIMCDFSIVNNMKYYNGIVFRGFLKGIYEGVLSGGQYDNLLKKMGRKSGAIGFALYLDRLEDII